MSTRIDPRRLEYLERMGVQVWELRGRGVSDPHTSTPPAADTQDDVRREVPSGSVDTDGPPPVSELGWDALRASVSHCTACGLQETRTQTVFGRGDRQAEWMVVGEAPGAEEDRQGEPFVGRAGKLLDAMLKAAGFARNEAYIANILKCRPPGNRDPRPEEVVCCEPFLQRQIGLARPRLILAVGRIAAQNLLKTDAPLSRLRGRVHRYGETGIPVVVTYHPAYLLRSPLEKRKAWKDLQLAIACSSRKPNRAAEQ